MAPLASAACRWRGMQSAGEKFSSRSASIAARLRHARTLSGGPPVRVRSGSGSVTTLEQLTLISFPDEFVEGAGAAAVDTIWSLQYMAPGALCGAGGPVIEVPVAELQQQQQQQQQSGQQRDSITHAVLLRFGNEKTLAAFEQHPKSKAAITAVLEGACQALTMTTITTQLPNNLESLFRRGGDFDVGFELVMLLRMMEGASKADAEDVLSQLQMLAESSMFGAVQAAHGPCSALRQLPGEPPSHNLPAASEADYVFLSRFQLQEQLQDFLKCPPVAALLQADDRLPLRAEWAGVMEIAPTEKSNTSKQGRGGLL